ncbi:hypothetical protein NDU88_003233 [Pleurodeles waltl]|uniref:Uncharacterized protein n=1 Tax=Pleurodeles waltl TaxID=8319 RepID=A0AAV7VGV4_PLEWA|nr:hypothetical protein NDU88_003233 [Pleurodeles waltl]
MGPLLCQSVPPGVEDFLQHPYDGAQAGIDGSEFLPEAQILAAVCTANGIPWLNDCRVDSCVVIVWAYFCWRDGEGFVFASLSLTFGVADLCGCLNFGGFRAVGHNDRGGIPLPQWCVGGLLHGGKRLLPPML